MRRPTTLLVIALIIAGVATALFPLVNKTKKLAEPMESIFKAAEKEAQEQ